MITRFAPSPTGYLHLGHAYSALFAYGHCEDNNSSEPGKFILRIEDIDQGRCRPHYIEAIEEDLTWLGLSWDEPVRKQSDHMEDYAANLGRLRAMGLTYPCFCTRKQIKQEIEAAGYAPHDIPSGPDGHRYPGTCAALSLSEREGRISAGENHAIRLDMDKAISNVGILTWHDLYQGEITASPQIFGDIILARKDTPTSYHLAVTTDDYLQGITLVTRGEDLFTATHIHRLLQALLGFSTPEYHHHPLLSDQDGKRLAKRDKASTIRDLRAQGLSVRDVRKMVLG